MAKLQQLRAKKLRNDQLSAEELVLDELFFDLYRINFVRGICFGFGSVLGGTIFVAAMVALFTWFSNIAPGGLSSFFRWIIDTITQR